VDVIVDTSVWSLALRRSDGGRNRTTQELAELVSGGLVVMIGPIRQELLSGIKGSRQFRTLKERLRAFPDEPLAVEDYEEAAQCFNRCREKGVQGSNTDFLICAVALRRKLTVFTTDKDFAQYSKVLGVRLHAPA
jgi:predicted nucleic acid-binding protein